MSSVPGAFAENLRRYAPATRRLREAAQRYVDAAVSPYSQARSRLSVIPDRDGQLGSRRSSAAPRRAFAGCTIDHSFDLSEVSTHIVARSQLSSEMTSCTTVEKRSSVGRPCWMDLVIVMIACARRSATRVCSLFSRVFSLRSALSSA